MEKLCNHTFLFHKTIEITSFWKSHPFRINSEQQTLVQIPRKAFQRLSWKSRIFSLIPIIIVAQSILAQQAPALMDKIKIFISFLGLSTCAIHSCACIGKAFDIVFCVNGILQLLQSEESKNLVKKRVGIIAYLNIFFVHGIYLTITAFPFVFVYGLHWQNSCIPSIVGYWMIPECYSQDHPESIGSFNFIFGVAIKIGILVGNQFAWSFGIFMTGMVVGGLQILLVMMLIDCLRIFWSSLRLSKNAETLQKAWLLYRQLQLLGSLNNEIQQGIVLTIMLVDGVFLHALSLSSVVRLFKQFSEGHPLPMIPFSVFLMVTIDTLLLVIVTFGGMSAVYRESKHIIKRKAKWHIHSCFDTPSAYSRMDLKWQEKFHKSCPLVKVKFGGNNFIEELTPLNCINMAVGMTVQLLLLKG